MSGMWKRSYGNATKALPDERGGQTDMRILRSPRHISTLLEHLSLLILSHPGAKIFSRPQIRAESCTLSIPFRTRPFAHFGSNSKSRAIRSTPDTYSQAAQHEDASIPDTRFSLAIRASLVTMYRSAGS